MTSTSYDAPPPEPTDSPTPSEPAAAESSQQQAPLGDSVATDSVERRRLTFPTRALPVFFVLLAIGAVILVFASRTVHRWSPEELFADTMAQRSHFQTTYWLEHGYFKSGGLLVSTSAAQPVFFYRSSTGGVYLSGFLVQKVYSIFTDRYSWRLMALHNQIFLLITSALLGLLGFQLARLLGAIPLHAMALAISLEAVHFTFPDNLMTYWEMSSRIPWLLFACIFLLLEVRSIEARSRALSITQALSAFALTYMEFIAGIAFVVSYVIATILLNPRSSPWKRLLTTSIIPMCLALVVYKGQLKWVEMQFPEIPMTGSEFMFRTGFDGSPKYYVDHLDIVTRRDVIQAAVFPKAGPWLFRWKWLFIAGTATLIGILFLAMRDRVRMTVVVSILSLLGSYLLYAAFFSQAVFIHPYLYDVMIFAPLMLALFVIGPSLIERATENRGIAVVAIVFLAIWVSTVQMRRYALQYPAPPQEQTQR
jgi:hypothetical protein